MGNVLEYYPERILTFHKSRKTNAHERTIVQPYPAASACALHQAAKSSNPRLVFSLLECGADVNARDDAGNSPLLSCLLCSSESWESTREIVQLLINYNCDVNAREANNQRRSALHIACTKGLDRVAEQLLLAGADPNYADRRGRTALHAVLWKLSWHRERSADSEYLQIALRLLRLSRATVVSRDKEGVTPLLLTVVAKNLLLLRIVLAKGAGRFRPDDVAGALLALDHVGNGVRARRLLIEAEAARERAVLGLRELCRAAVLRRLFGCAVDGSEVVDKLLLPLSLKRFLLLQDVEGEGVPL